LFARDTRDEELVQAIFNTNPLKKSDGGRPTMHIIDCRNQLAANANRIKGAGVESAKTYQCTITFMNIQNIHGKFRNLEKLSQGLGLTGPLI